MTTTVVRTFAPGFIRWTAPNATLELNRATQRPAASQSFAQNLPGGPVTLRLGPDGALYLIEYGGWFQATTNDAITRITFRP